MDRSRVYPLGVPTFERYFSFDPAATAPPYPFPYVLFAGCALPFDVRAALQTLDDTLTQAGEQELRIVYRPHPWRQPRNVDDSVNEHDFSHVTIDHQVREEYLAAIGRSRPADAGEFLPALDYYPALVGHARFVICPLSTMTLESAILGRPVLVLAYDDGIHDIPPNVVARFDHFEGLDRIEGFEPVHRLEELGPTFRRMLMGDARPSVRAQIRPWLHFDGMTYAERLERLVARLATR
jgi:hypothetical protein